MSTERTTDVGKKIRYDRIVNPGTGKTVMIPLDHGVILGPVAGIEDPGDTVRQVVTGGADAVILNAGMAGNLYPEYGNRCGSILNLSNIITGENDLTLIGSVEYALKQAAGRHLGSGHGGLAPRAAHARQLPPGGRGMPALEPAAACHDVSQPRNCSSSGAPRPSCWPPAPGPSWAPTSSRPPIRATPGLSRNW